MTRYGILMNVQSCLGCRTCMLSCKNAYEIPAGNYQGREYYRIWPADLEMGKYPYVVRNETIMRCMQCQNPPCVAACPIPGVLTQRKDGIVVVNGTNCIGDLACVAACPYGAIYYRADTMTADKCDLCASKLDAGQTVPTCVSTCLGDAMVFGDLDDPSSAISQMLSKTGAKALRPDYGTNPSVYFIPHAAVLHAQAVNELGSCLMDATPTLTDLSTNISTTASLDAQGRFVFRNLTVGNKYSLAIAASGYRSYSLPSLTVTNEYLDLGKVALISKD